MALAIPHAGGGRSEVVTVSLGVAAGHAGAVSVEERVRGADAALYAAKRAGRDRVAPPPWTAGGRDPKSDGLRRNADFGFAQAPRGLVIRRIAAQCGFRLRSSAARASQTLSGRDRPDSV
ncbi:response regulator receiver protein [Methylobacterium sp. 4-46]|uniref:diguanylate cyclase domain-containing protein n=1 Tax=Methylobacterium sp. CB376 TaxID=3138063 RepID=UPI000152D6DA|nr:response regulator receiver protein [Methylobacterium sp. 4-46]